MDPNYNYEFDQNNDLIKFCKIGPIKEISKLLIPEINPLADLLIIENVLYKNRHGNTALHMAVIYKQPKVVKILIDFMRENKLFLYEKNNYYMDAYDLAYKHIRMSPGHDDAAGSEMVKIFKNNPK
jgi:hypothetical protein